MLISDVFTIKAENIYGNDTYIPRRHKQRRLTAKTEWLRPACHLHKIKKVNSIEPFQFIILHKHSSPHINALFHLTICVLHTHSSTHINALFHLTICLLHKHSNPHSVSGMNLPLFVVSTQALKHSLCFRYEPPFVCCFYTSTQALKRSRRHSVSACMNMLLQKTDLIIQQCPYQTSKGCIKSLVFSTTLHLKEGALQVIQHTTWTVWTAWPGRHTSALAFHLHTYLAPFTLQHRPVTSGWALTGCGPLHLHLWSGPDLNKRLDFIYTCDLDQTWIRG